eukprot:CAMPEP_0204373300 /NCGR_PEP_ID=MMETSP0469-20131031/47921_1 /ASSEMBLY_ACC=CAM_ASM_000384 /TAXON_ID=2969 /ORGANISM="Oxyrrhis marina" /LENGTH=49 /DNA_ID=CAMNT_0051363725 /DNA_START=40 /DNA_END=189 /DNA_ORIENTATION=-
MPTAPVATCAAAPRPRWAQSPAEFPITRAPDVASAVNAAALFEANIRTN